MERARSGPLAAWATSWVRQGGPADEVIDAVTGADAPHVVVGLDGRSDTAAPLSEALIRWRRSGDAVRLVLPVAGDLRGVPGPAPFREAALDAGAAVYGGGFGIVPLVTDYSPSSAPPSVVWTAYQVTPAPTDFIGVADAQYDLTAAIRECASTLAAADVAGSREDLTDGLSTARRAGEHVNLPPGFPPRAVALVAQAERLNAILELALVDPVGGAIDQHGMNARVTGLRPLESAVRRALLAGYNALAD